LKFIKKIKDLFNLSQRIAILESEIQEIDINIEHTIEETLKEFQRISRIELVNFEKKIQQLSFDYTANLEDTKSQYLKKYVEVRMDCMQQELSQIPEKIGRIQADMNKLLTVNKDKE
jgi:hypothetical protein